MTPTIKQFKDFNIKPKIQSFVGDKIKIDKVLNREITIHEFRIEDSKFDGKCLHLQITLKDETRVLFTGSATLIDLIKQVPADSFPFNTTIIKDNDRFEFT